MRQIVFFLILSTSLYAQNYPKEDIGAVVSKSSNSILLVLSHHRPDNLKFNLDSVVSNVNDTIAVELFYSVGMSASEREGFEPISPTCSISVICENSFR